MCWAVGVGEADAIAPVAAVTPAAAPFPRVARLASLDLLRGLVVLLMLFVNQADAVVGAPGFLRHAEDGADTITLADVVLPAFLFMAGMSIPFALGRRLHGAGALPTLRHVLARGAALLGLGLLVVNAEMAAADGPLAPQWWGFLAVCSALLVWHVGTPGLRSRALRAAGGVLLVVLILVYRGSAAGGLVQLQPHWWGILGILGWAYLTASSVYIAARERPWLLLAVALLLNGLYYVDVLLQPSWIVSAHRVLGVGSLLGSQAAVAVAGTALGVLAARLAAGAPRRLRLSALAFAAILLAAGMLLHLGHGWHPGFAYSKPDATPPWGLVCAGITALAWLAFHLAADVAGVRRWPLLLRVTGENPLLTYLLEPLAIALLAASAVVFGRNPWACLVERGTASGLLAAVLFACLLGHLAGLLARAGLRLRL